MPQSFAERYMQGILGGLDIKRTQQQMRLGEIRNRLLEEEIADMQESRKRRKSLLNLMSKLDPTLQESVLLKEGFSGLPWEATPFGQERKVAEERTAREKEMRETSAKYSPESLETLRTLGIPISPYMPKATIRGGAGGIPGVTTVPLKGTPLGIRKAVGEATEVKKPSTTRAMTNDERYFMYMRMQEKGQKLPAGAENWIKRYLEGTAGFREKAPSVYTPEVEKKRKDAQNILKSLEDKEGETGEDLSPGEQVLRESAQAYLDSTMGKYGTAGFVGEKAKPPDSFYEWVESVGSDKVEWEKVKDKHPDWDLSEWGQ